ncbi:YHS domain-containing (seleno)protein [Deefgea rivuli]|uniref:YHS domain-containing (seleno)protein n=1 Tax=Deefgea rivuli TaxID=400948 RepID=UPI000485B2DC|nr:YHS domain-containing (seleno)protein [Deefgea rivuli]
MFSPALRSCILAATLLISAPVTVLAFDANSSRPVNVNEKGVALRGFDPMSYFTGKGPMMGSDDYKFVFEGATYWFASAENLAKFKANPTQYAPKFGAFCAMGIAKDKKIDSDPTAWRIVDGYLFVLQSKEVQKNWLVDVSGNLKVATVSWNTIKNIAPKGL